MKKRIFPTKTPPIIFIGNNPMVLSNLDRMVKKVNDELNTAFFFTVRDAFKKNEDASNCFMIVDNDLGEKELNFFLNEISNRAFLKQSVVILKEDDSQGESLTQKYIEVLIKDFNDQIFENLFLDYCDLYGNHVTQIQA